MPVRSYSIDGKKKAVAFATASRYETNMHKGFLFASENLVVALHACFAEPHRQAVTSALVRHYQAFMFPLMRRGAKELQTLWNKTR